MFLKTLFLCTYRRSCLPALSLLDLVDGIGVGYLVSVVVLVLSCWFMHYLYISCAHGLCLLLLLGTYINTKLYICQRNSELR